MANNRVKRFIKDLEGLGFNYDNDASSPRNGRRVYRHPASPDEVIRVADGMSDSGITMVRRKAEQIAGLTTRENTAPASIRERARIKKSAERERRDAETAARNERASRAEAAHREREAIRAVDRHDREMRDLMNTGFGK